MFSDDWRQILYYPLGLAPCVFFSLRFLIQWIQSEKRKKSYTDKLFWQLSISGNVLLALHYFIQFQYIFLIIQSGNAIIAWRNLNLMQKNKPPLSFRNTLIIFGSSFAVISALFFMQSHFLSAESYLFGIKKIASQPDISFLWSLLGIVGGFLFASRFWIQWWHAEKNHRGELDRAFWVLSILGSVITLIFSLHVSDYVSLVNYSFGLVPYLRNLMLLKKERVYT